MNPKTETAKACRRLNSEADRYAALARDKIVGIFHGAGLPTPEEARLIRDHEIRAETFRAAAKLLAP